MSTLLPSTISIVTALSRTRSVVRTEVVLFFAIAPSDGSRTSLLVALRRQRSPVRAVWAVTSNWSERGVVKPTGQLWFTLTVLISMHSPLAIVVGRMMVTLQLPADLARRSVPPQSASVDGPKLLAAAQLPKRRDKVWEIELAPLTRMEAWKVPELGNQLMRGMRYQVADFLMTVDEKDPQRRTLQFAVKRLPR